MAGLTMRHRAELIGLAIQEIIRRATPGSVKNIEAASIQTSPFDEPSEFKASPPNKRQTHIGLILAKRLSKECDTIGIALGEAGPHEPSGDRL
jgi:hypothetical protein